MADAYNDKWLDLIERFTARGAQVRIGNMQPDMIKHLLDTVEELDVRVRGLENALLRRKDDGGDGRPAG